LRPNIYYNMTEVKVKKLYMFSSGSGNNTLHCYVLSNCNAKTFISKAKWRYDNYCNHSPIIDLIENEEYSYIQLLEEETNINKLKDYARMCCNTDPYCVNDNKPRSINANKILCRISMRNLRQQRLEARLQVIQNDENLTSNGVSASALT
jgi:hypothetical protein